MQTFLPYADFQKSAAVLDRSRLGKQRVEAAQILDACFDPDNGWRNHPAVQMWIGYEPLLFEYTQVICHEWSSIRGYKDSVADKLRDKYVDIAEHEPGHPSWLGSEPFHKSHRAALLHKDEHYTQFDWTEQPEIDYVWPE
mgnify:CR=1 FL=1